MAGIVGKAQSVLVSQVGADDSFLSQSGSSNEILEVTKFLSTLLKFFRSSAYFLSLSISAETTHPISKVTHLEIESSPPSRKRMDRLKAVFCLVRDLYLRRRVQMPVEVNGV